ncbi:protein phosphatase 2C domain-containing protein [Acidimicrobiia bacterium]|nr:protein phosphatase 2C domain-containing protein [Acidimicrobiia bacterium]|tara:strand:- start:1409 stop:2068 length:660 start_codon:yes stop_codon:yes gene_type:complete
MNNIRLVWSIRTECGPNRNKNEDSVFPNKSGSGNPPFKAAVCDGLGGHVKGDVASNIAASNMNNSFDDLVSVITTANLEILKYQEKNKESVGMGTTMTAITVDEDGLMKIGHVGDTRCYVLSNRKLLQLTQDHNVPGFQNILEKALGSNENLKIEHQDFQLKNGDVVLLCSDGLYNEFSDEYLKKKLQEGISADTLVGEALIQKPKDNVSAVIINIFSK